MQCAADLCEGLFQRGGHLYVCGDGQAMAKDVHEALVAVLAAVGDDAWAEIQGAVVDGLVNAGPSSLAACFQIHTLKSALFADASRGRSRWRAARFGIVSRLLRGRLRIAEARGPAAPAEIRSATGVIAAVRVLRELDFPAVIAAAAAAAGGGRPREPGAAHCVVAAEGGWEVLSCLRAADLVLEDAVDEDVDEDDLAEWIEILKHVGRCIRGNNTKFERILKAAVTEFSSRYGFIRKQGQGQASSIGGTPRKSQSPLKSQSNTVNLLGAIDEECAVDGAVDDGWGM